MNKNELYDYCFNRLQSIESILQYTFLKPMDKIRLTARRNILKHLIDYETYVNFVDKDEILKYVEYGTDIICGFYEN